MIFVECKPDALLVQSVARFPRKELIHEFKGKYEVCKRLQQHTNCKGLIDEDPSAVQPPYLKRIHSRQDLPEHGLRVLGDESRGNRLIVLCPRLEEWLLKTAEEAGIKMEGYSLPNEPGALHREINADLRKLGRLMEGLNLRKSQRLTKLRECLEGALDERPG